MNQCRSPRGLRQVLEAPSAVGVGLADHPETPGAGLDHSLPWWAPAKIVVRLNDAQDWRTLPGWSLNDAAGKGAIAVSPLDDHGQAHFIAWDIDTGDPSDVREILKALPRGAQPLVSWSGRKGWHVWVFPDEPVGAQRAVAFAREVRDRAGLRCEIFPSSERSKCLKWPGQIHPDTGEPEVFVHPTDLRDTERFDTTTTLLALREGFLRTPTPVILKKGPVEVETTPRKVPVTSPRTTPVPVAPPSQPVGRGERRGRVSPLSCDERLVAHLFQIAGRDPVPLGRKFRCLLPGHPERHPSAAFFRGESGQIFYHDLHASKYGTEEWLTLGEVYHALEVGHLEELTPWEKARALAALALNAGVELPLTTEVRERLERASHALAGVEVLPLPDLRQLGVPSWGVGISSCCTGGSELGRVWEGLCREALISAQGGFEEIKASVRFLASQVNLPADVVNRALNLLCSLGIAGKVRGSGGRRGDRFVINECDESEVRRRWEALGKPALARVNRRRVEERLGRDTACAVFRRRRAEEKIKEVV